MGLVGYGSRRGGTPPVVRVLRPACSGGMVRKTGTWIGVIVTNMRNVSDEDPEPTQYLLDDPLHFTAHFLRGTTRSKVLPGA